MVVSTMKGRVTKWVGLAAAIWVQSSAGNANTFPHYSATLKSELHYNQVQLNNLGVAKDFGENVGLLAGLVCNSIPPWAVLLIGAMEGLFGYGVLWLVVSERIAPLPYWLLCALLWIGANSTTWFNTAALVTSMRNFPNSRGTVVGIVKGFIGLSSAIFTQIFVSFLRGDATTFLLFLAVEPMVICLVVMYFIRPVRPEVAQQIDPEESRNFFFIHIICIAMAIYLLVATVATHFFPMHFASPGVVTVGMLVILCAPLGVPLKCVFDKYCRFPRQEIAHANGVREPLLTSVENPSESSDEDRSPVINQPPDVSTEKSEAGPGHVHEKLNLSPSPLGYSESSPTASESDDSGTLLAVGEGAVRRRKGPRRGEDFTLSEAIVKADFWLLFFTFFCGVGTGTTAINNLGQIGQAQGFADVTIFVALISVWNFLGRLGGGSVSEHYVRSSAIPRTVWMGASQVLLIVGHLLFASAVPGSLYIGSMILGFCYGVHIAIMVPTASELFGLKHFGMIYNFMTMGNPVGSLLFSGLLAGYLYDREAGISSKLGIFDTMLRSASSNQALLMLEAEDVQCTGAHCFRMTFLVLAVTAMIGVILNVILTLRIRRVYAALYGTKSRDSSTTSLIEQGRSH